MNLIPEWKDVWKFYSSWAVLALTAWNMIPIVLVELIPVHVNLAVSAVLMGLYLLARIVNQPTVSKGSDNGET